jgi:3-mercaptopyruvate sulfurtransferase SseA
MRRAVVVGVVLGVISGVSLAGRGAGEAQAMRNVPRITIDEVKKLMAANQVVLIDVRDPMAFGEGRIPGAVNVPFDHLPNHIDAWKKEKRLLVTYCA